MMPVVPYDLPAMGSDIFAPASNPPIIPNHWRNPLNIPRSQLVELAPNAAPRVPRPQLQMVPLNVYEQPIPRYIPPTKGPHAAPKSVAPAPKSIPKRAAAKGPSKAPIKPSSKASIKTSASVSSKALGKASVKAASKGTSSKGAPTARPTVAQSSSSRPAPKAAMKAGGIQYAVDPGPVGLPPGPRIQTRPHYSFAALVGHAILASPSGGLSLDHIYRWIATAYPFFSSEAGTWRNSVRHNLSIHKMFKGMPRDERFPAGKGGIWYIPEEERVHFSADGSFTKNFQSDHPHYATCLQSQWELKKAIADSQRKAIQDQETGDKPPQSQPEPTSPEYDFEDDGDFVPENEHPPSQPAVHATNMPLFQIQTPSSAHVTRSFSSDETFSSTKRKNDEDITFSSGRKRIRLPDAAPPTPTEGIDDDTLFQAFLRDDADIYQTPIQSASAARRLGLSKGLFTPSLVYTSSSPPTSSPMPDTDPRNRYTHALKLGSITADVLHSLVLTSPARVLADAFDLQSPASMKSRMLP